MTITLVFIIILILLVAMLLLSTAVRLWQKNERPDMNVTRDGHGSSHDFYTNQRGKR